MKIAIYGGAFNPVHTEHVNIARSAVKHLNIDKLIVMPTAVSPHKSGCLCASAEDRLEMCRLAFADINCAEVSDYEITRGGVSYSYLTCEHIREEYPEADIFFVMGADMLASFPRWKNPERILQCVTLAACAREDEKAFPKIRKSVEKALGTHVKKVPYVGKAVSSTRVRVLASLGEDISGYVNAQVGQYIKDQGVYALGNLRRAKQFLKPHRWQHTVRVAAMCAKYAARANVSEEQAITMGALHDVAKYMTADSPYLAGLELPEGVPESVVHQFAGAYVAAEMFGVTDETVLNAIRYHTSARPGMTAADTLLYLCDMLEEERDFPGVGKLRKIFEKDMEKCLYAALKDQVKYLDSTGAPVYDLTGQAYLYLAEKRKKEKNNDDV